MDADASDNRLGVVLSNIVNGAEYPVAVASRVLTPAGMMLLNNKRKALAVIQATGSNLTFGEQRD